MYLCRPSEASTRYCAIPGGYPPQDWQSLPCAGEELDLNPGLLICSQVRYHWATSPSNILPFRDFSSRGGGRYEKEQQINYTEVKILSNLKGLPLHAVGDTGH